MNENKYDFRIIVIDDNAEIHQDFLKILTRNTENELVELERKVFNTTTLNPILPQFKIDTVTQAKDAEALIFKARAEKAPYALAFVDICMPPEWDVIETIKKIWAIDPDIHIVICTAFSDYSWVETIQELGHCDNLLLLKKPFDSIVVRQLSYALTRKWKLLRDSRIYTHALEEAVEKRTAELKFQATHDVLTGLSNRALLCDRIQQAIAVSKRHRFNFAVLFFDLDRFKLVNDSLGHSAGDILLSVLAKRLLLSIRDIDTLARLGGDEFVLIVNELKDVNYIQNVASKILNIIREPLDIAGHTLKITSSMGVAIYPQDGKVAADLLQNADTAMYHAKKLGCDQFQFYSTAINRHTLDQLKLESQLYEATSNKEFTIWYQPQINIENYKLYAVEALIRWNHPQKGLLLPIDFIPLAEQTGLIIPIGEWVIEEACRQNKYWQDLGLPPVRMGVNVNSQQMSQPDFVQKIIDILQKTKLEPKYLELELNENSILNDTIVAKLTELKALGIEIALDDFGTGYSSLYHLRSHSLDRLKIDRSFIYNIDFNCNDESIIHAIILMAESMNLDVLAAGVETQKQLDFLLAHNCKQIQGFYFCKPLPAEDLQKLFESPNLIDKMIGKEMKEHT